MRHRDDIEDLSKYTTLPDHFYFSECWDSDTKSLEDIPSEARWVIIVGNNVGE